ncbi:caspase-1-like isoform X2 [Zootermopsis nevadensis]|uniref:caspase-1-like isoform X2 n=1 Tax=Zootermopsis nevadensis TaxID=136037 RepID=UPI000B8EC26C|nr:caspase-1-like isoform X2 [Zootermopsis nevadensis]
MEREKIENCHEKEIAEHVSENESQTDAWAFDFKSRGTDSVAHDAADVSAGPGCDKDAEEYNMRHPKRGVALILNHQEFADVAPRRGSSRDCENLCAELEKLGFETRVHQDLTYIALSAVLTETLEDHSTADCIMVIAMTHGDSGYLHSRDTVYHTQELWLHFTGDMCPTLVGKPKIFFIQACRGTMVDSGVSVDVTDSYTTSYVLPTQADILIAYSTVDGTDGYYSWRNPRSGSWFIQALCHELQTHGRTRDLLTLLTFVCRRVAIDYQSTVPGDENMDRKKQIPVITSMLTRLVYFGQNQRV